MFLQQLNIIKLSFLHKKKTATLFNTTGITKNILICLLKNNYIKNFVTNNNQTVIYLNLNKCYKNILLKNIFKPSQKKTITIRNLKKDFWKKTKNIYILSTSLGVLTHQEAIKYNVGGVFLLKIFN